MPNPARPLRTPRALTLRVAASSLALATAALFLPPAAPASADLVGGEVKHGKVVGGYAVAASSYLCTGYTSCEAKGYSHAGYKQNNSNEYWRMYAGHNCTNYAAYRMVKAGLPNTRPWSGTGNAYNWGPANAEVKDSTATVGAVAWWKANVPGAGSLGHVAYVERVVSADEIIISEDSWGGNFHWRRVGRSSGWPSGFLHFTGSPAATGSPRGWTDKVTSSAAHRLRLTGWSFDPDKLKKHVFIRVYVGGPAKHGERLNLDSAKLSRPDVAKVYPTAGQWHGFDQTMKVKKTGKQTVYVYGLNKKNTPGKMALLGKRTVTVKS
jgi:surface antigen